MSRVFVRFAPSPTGFLHIGGARTALYNVMFARKHKGTCILRIDDTDLVRSEDRFLNDIKESLSWLGLTFHETYKQSDRTEVYEAFIKRLNDQGLLYTDKSEKGEALVFKAEKKDLFFDDQIRGRITLESAEVSNIVIRKSDGTPTYIFASTVDDIDMGITHIIRGEDHISNTFKQLSLFQTLEPDRIPLFAHLPLIHSEDGTRLSKRHGATSVTEFKNTGYLPEAMINTLLLLGWSPGENTEIIDFEEACSLFSISHISKKAAQFSYEKAAWMNGQYIKKTDSKDLISRSLDISLKKIKKYADQDKDKLIKAFELTKNRPRFLNAFEDAVNYFFEPEIRIPEELLGKYFSEKNIPVFLKLKTAIMAIQEFSAPNIETALRGFAQEQGMKAKDILVPLRVILSGKNVTPGIFDVMALMGKELCMKRIIDFQMHAPKA